MRIGHIFILVGTLVALIVGGIVLAFALVATNAVEKAVLSAVKAELDHIKTAVEKIVDVTVAPAKTARQRLLANNWTIGNLPAYMQPIDQEQTQLRNFTGAFEVFVATLDAQPELISFCYLTGKSSYDPSLWFDFGSIAGPPTTVEVPDGIENATIISGVFPPWNLVAEEILPRGVTGESWQIETAMVNDTENGGWMSVASYADEFTGETTSLMTYSLPLVIDPTTGECTCGLNIDISADGLTSLLKTIATKGNSLFLFDVRKTYLYDGAFIASSLPESALPQYDPDTEETFFPTQTPNGAVNSMMQRVFDEYGGSIEDVRNSQEDLIITDHEDLVVAVAHVYAAGNLHWIVVSSIPNEYYYGSTETTLNATIGAAVVSVVVICACFVAVHLSLARPIVKMLESMQNIASLNEGALEKDEPFLTELRPVHQELSRLDLAVQSFSRYVPKDVVQGLLATSSLCSLEMNPASATVLFSEIKDFSDIFYNVPSNVLNELLTIYFDTMTLIIMEHAGVIDKFIGDVIMCVFNVPRQVEKPEALAVMCALQMQRATQSGPLLAAFDEHGEEPYTRVGITSGEVLAGNVGSKMRMSYTVFGDIVNFASRLSMFCRQVETRTLISETVAVIANRDANLCCRLLGRVLVQGKGVAIAIYEPFGLYENTTTSSQQHQNNNNNAIKKPTATGFHLSGGLTGLDFSGGIHDDAGNLINNNNNNKSANKSADDNKNHISEDPSGTNTENDTDSEVELAGTAVEVTSPALNRLTGRGTGTFARLRRTRSSDGRNFDSRSFGSAGGRSSLYENNTASVKGGGGKDNNNENSVGGGSSSHRSAAYFKSERDMLSHFQSVSRAAHNECPVTLGQRYYAKVFSKAAKLFTLGQFSACLDLLNRINGAIMNVEVPATTSAQNFSNIPISRGGSAITLLNTKGSFNTRAKLLSMQKQQQQQQPGSPGVSNSMPPYLHAHQFANNLQNEETIGGGTASGGLGNNNSSNVVVGNSASSFNQNNNTVTASAAAVGIPQQQQNPPSLPNSNLGVVEASIEFQNPTTTANNNNKLESGTAAAAVTAKPTAVSGAGVIVVQEVSTSSPTPQPLLPNQIHSRQQQVKNNNIPIYHHGHENSTSPTPTSSGSFYRTNSAGAGGVAAHNNTNSQQLVLAGVVGGSSLPPPVSSIELTTNLASPTTTNTNQKMVNMQGFANEHQQHQQQISRRASVEHPPLGQTIATLFDHQQDPTIINALAMFQQQFEQANDENKNTLLDSFLAEFRKAGGPSKCDKPTIMLRELCVEYIQHPPEDFLGAIVAKGK